MEAIKTLIIARFRILLWLTVSMTLSIVLLMIRMKLNQSIFFMFLVWNLFLALIPFTITMYLSSKKNIPKWSLLLWFGIWLLFLPNAPYIITDLLHLRMSDKYLMWLDVLVVSSFACNGMILFFLSLMDMESLLRSFTSVKIRFYLITFVLFLTAFGIYLGRFLRYNSWEILQHPYDLFTDILNIIIQPNQYVEAWIFSLFFGIFLSVGFWMFKAFLKIKTN
jgi:uncharacterized membrane protein